MIPPSSKIIDNTEAYEYAYRRHRHSGHRSVNALGLNMVGGSGSGGGAANGNKKSMNAGNVNANVNAFINQMNRMKYKYHLLDASDVTRAFGPIAIIGGTVSIYTAALSHSSTTLTPLSVVYLLLLALNYSIMPRITKKYVSPKVNKESVALVEEVVKMSMGVGGFILTECISPSSPLELTAASATAGATAGAAGAGAATIATTTTALGSTFPIPIQQILQTCTTNIQNALSNWSIQSSLLAAGLPSALYAIQGVLTYTSYQNLDSVTFNGITQIKTLSAALCCYIVLGKVQSSVQILALALLSLSTLVFQGKGTGTKLIKAFLFSIDRILMNCRRWISGSGSSSTTTISSGKDGEQQRTVTSGGGDDDSAGVTAVDGKKRFLLGIVPCLGATFLSGLAGAFSQRSLQTVVGSMERNAYFYSAEISFFSALCLLISMATKKVTKSSSSTIKNKKGDVSKRDDVGYFDHWTWHTFIPIVVKATGGILTALVHKHSGSVMKGFSLVLGLVFSALLQTVLDGKDLTFGQMFGTALVLLSSWLHFTNPST